MTRAFQPRPNRRTGDVGLRLPFAVVAVLVTVAAWAQAKAPEPSDEAAESAGDVVLVRVDSPIQAVVAEFVGEALTEADASSADLFLFELNTPGGDLVSTQKIYTAMLEAKTPVVVYVAPQGAEAASAGFFILMAADVAAMSPSTNTGAAHPVGPGGQDIEGDIGAKVEQNAAAKIRSLAARNGRNEELAEEAVVESRSFTAEEAKELGLIDLVAADREALLAALEGYELAEEDGTEVAIELGPTPEIRQIEMTLFQRLRSVLADPNVVALLFSIGSLGILVELYNPGSIFPGVIGLICLILAFSSMSVLPVNYAGVALLVLAAILFVAEIKVPSFGFLTLAGVTCLSLGMLMLFKTPDPALRVSRQLILALAVLSVVVVVSLSTLTLRVHRSQVHTGREGLVHELGMARSAIDPEGKVTVHGEIWNAVAEAPVAAGEAVEVISVEGMRLRVRPVRTG